LRDSFIQIQHQLAYFIGYVAGFGRRESADCYFVVGECRVRIAAESSSVGIVRNLHAQEHFPVPVAGQLSNRWRAQLVAAGRDDNR
jgi:hypothetical protein